MLPQHLLERHGGHGCGGGKGPRYGRQTEYRLSPLRQSTRELGSCQVGHGQATRGQPQGGEVSLQDAVGPTSGGGEEHVQVVQDGASPKSESGQFTLGGGYRR